MSGDHTGPEGTSAAQVQQPEKPLGRRGIVEPVDKLDQNKPVNPKLPPALEEDVRAHRFDLMRPVWAIVSSRASSVVSRSPPRMAARAMSRTSTLLAHLSSTWSVTTPSATATCS